MKNRSDRESEAHPTADLWSRAQHLQGLLYSITAHLEKAPARHVHAPIAGRKGKQKRASLPTVPGGNSSLIERVIVFLFKQKVLAMWLKGCRDVQINGCMEF